MSDIHHDEATALVKEFVEGKGPGEIAFCCSRCGHPRLNAVKTVQQEAEVETINRNGTFDLAEKFHDVDVYVPDYVEFHCAQCGEELTEDSLVFTTDREEQP